MTACIGLPEITSRLFGTLFFKSISIKVRRKTKPKPRGSWKCKQTGAAAVCLVFTVHSLWTQLYCGGGHAFKSSGTPLLACFYLKHDFFRACFSSSRALIASGPQMLMPPPRRLCIPKDRLQAPMLAPKSRRLGIKVPK